MNKKSDNNVHLHGFVNDVRINAAEDGKAFINVKLATYEQFKNNAGESERRNTYHDVSLVTADPKVIKQFEEVRDALQNNRENRGKEGFEPKVTMASVDGTLVTRSGEKDGVKYDNQVVVTNAENFKLGAKRQEGEAMNTATFKGNVASIDMHDGFAIVSLATHYYAPGESQIHSGETKPYTEKTSFVKARVSENFKPEIYNGLKNGEIGVGDLVEARGQLHNTKHTDKDGITRYGIIADLNKLNVLAKKQDKKQEQQQEKAQEKTVKPAEKKPETKKATSKKTAVKNVAAAPKKATPVKRGPKIG